VAQVLDAAYQLAAHRRSGKPRIEEFGFYPFDE
jgi:hypothetical protein